MPDDGIPSGHYDVWNAGWAALTFGLMQAAAVNGRPFLSPLNAVVLPAALGAADFRPAEQLVVWTQSGVAAGMVIPEISGKVATIPFGAAGLVAYRFDGAAEAFVRASPVSRNPAL